MKQQAISLASSLIFVALATMLVLPPKKGMPSNATVLTEISQYFNGALRNVLGTAPKTKKGETYP